MVYLILLHLNMCQTVVIINTNLHRPNALLIASLPIAEFLWSVIKQIEHIRSLPFINNNVVHVTHSKCNCKANESKKDKCLVYFI